MYAAKEAVLKAMGVGIEAVFGLVMAVITGSSIAEAVAAESGFTGVEAARAANAMLRVIAQSLQRGERVSVPGFGAFSVRDRKGRTGHNPATGKAIRIEAKRVVKFKPGKALQFDAAPSGASKSVRKGVRR